MFKLGSRKMGAGQLFDRTRCYSEIRPSVLPTNRECYDEQAIPSFRELESAGFWYRTVAEKNVLLLCRAKKSGGRI